MEPIKIVGVERALDFYLLASERVYPRAIMLDPSDGRVIFEANPDRVSEFYFLLRTDGCGACEFCSGCDYEESLCGVESVSLDDLYRLISFVADTKGFDFRWIDGSVYKHMEV